MSEALHFDLYSPHALLLDSLITRFWLCSL